MLSEVFFLFGVGMMMAGMACVILTGCGPAPWRKRCGAAAPVCFGLGACCFAAAVVLTPPPGPGYSGYAY